jgi:hypothetical protein
VAAERLQGVGLLDADAAAFASTRRLSAREQPLLLSPALAIS